MTVGKKVGAFIKKMSNGFIFFFTEMTEGRNVYRINFVLDIFKVTVACNYFNQSAHLTTGEVKKKLAFGFDGLWEKVFGHTAVWVVLPLTVPNFIHIIPEMFFENGRGR